MRDLLIDQLIYVRLPILNVGGDNLWTETSGWRKGVEHKFSISASGQSVYCDQLPHVSISMPVLPFSTVCWNCVQNKHFPFRSCSCQVFHKSNKTSKWDEGNMNLKGINYSTIICKWYDSKQKEPPKFYHGTPMADKHLQSSEVNLLQD